MCVAAWVSVFLRLSVCRGRYKMFSMQVWDWGVWTEGGQKRGSQRVEGSGWAGEMVMQHDTSEMNLWLPWWKSRDGTVSQEPQIKPAVNDVWLVFRSCSCSEKTFCQLFVLRCLCYCSVNSGEMNPCNLNTYKILTSVNKCYLWRVIFQL